MGETGSEHWLPITTAPTDGTRIKVRGGSFGIGCMARFTCIEKLGKPRWVGDTNQYLHYYQPPKEWLLEHNPNA